VAVAEFARSLDPRVRVTHNARRPDIDTGRLRQRDVWIEADVCGVFPVKILVSCKRTHRPLSEQELDAFIGELRSSGAHKGVLYSYSGFTAGALEKAERTGICCCRIFQNVPADLPRTIVFQAYYCRPVMGIGFSQPLDARWKLASFADLFALRIPSASGEESVLVIVSTVFAEEFGKAYAEAEAKPLPPEWRKGLRIHDSDTEKDDIGMVLQGTWEIFTACPEAVLFDGTYSISGDFFVGIQRIPAPASADPGPSWVRLEARPDTAGLMGVTILQGLGDIPTILRESFSQKGLPLRE
jgi:hypothetical protein